MKTDDKQAKNKVGHRWAKGESGNPKGRPRKGLAVAEVIREQAEAIRKGDPDAKNRMDAVVAKAWEQAEAGDPVARKWLFDRMEGQARQISEVTTTEQMTVEEVVVNAKDTD